MRFVPDLPGKAITHRLLQQGGLEAWTGDWLIFLASLVPADTAFARCARTLVRRSGGGMMVFHARRSFEE
eukprot:9485993-Pyramimonas_sp.AAC.1